MIVKLQRPLGSSHSGPPWLAYDRRRSFTQSIPAAEISKETIRRMGDDAKGYFEASRTNDGKLVIGARVPNEGW